MKKLFVPIFVSAALALSACSTTTGLNAVSAQSSFDGTKRVGIPPHGLSCKTTGVFCTSLGFSWSSKLPNSAFITAQVLDLHGTMIGSNYVSISGMKLNIDGQIIELEPVNTMTDYDYNKIMGPVSSKGFVVPLSLLEKIHQSKNVKVQVATSKGFLEDYIINGEKDTKAYHALGRFLTELNANK